MNPTTMLCGLDQCSPVPIAFIKLISSSSLILVCSNWAQTIDSSSLLLVLDRLEFPQVNTTNWTILQNVPPIQNENSNI